MSWVQLRLNCVTVQLNGKCGLRFLWYAKICLNIGVNNSIEKLNLKKNKKQTPSTQEKNVTSIL